MTNKLTVSYNPLIDYNKNFITLHAISKDTGYECRFLIDVNGR